MARQQFVASLALESRRFLGKRNLVLFLLTFLIVIFFTNKGIIEQKAMPAKIKKFQQIQENIFSRLPNFQFYSMIGEKFLFVPSANAVFCRNWGLPPDTMAKINSIIDLKLSSNLKGRGLMFNLFFGRIDFTVIVLIWVSLLSMAFGFESLHTREYHLFVTSLQPRGRWFFPCVLPRFLLLAASFLLLFLGTVAFARVRGILFSPRDYTGLAVFLPVSLGLLLVFFSLGAFFGTLRSPRSALLYMLLVWGLLVFIAPGTFVSLVEDRFPDANRDLQTELNKLKTVTEFEKRVFEKYKSYTPQKKEIFKRFAEKFWDMDLKSGTWI
jgi:hypothetical protein